VGGFPTDAARRGVQTICKVGSALPFPTLRRSLSSSIAFIPLSSVRDAGWFAFISVPLSFSFSHCECARANRPSQAKFTPACVSNCGEVLVQFMRACTCPPLKPDDPRNIGVAGVTRLSSISPPRLYNSFIAPTLCATLCSVFFICATRVAAMLISIAVSRC